MNRKQLTARFLCNLIPWTVGNGLIPLLPVYAEQLGADSTAPGLYLAFSCLAIALGAVSAGWVSASRFGWKLPLVVGGLTGHPLAWLMTVAQVGQVVDKPKLVLAYGITETVIWLAVSFGALVAGVLYSRVHTLPFEVSLALLAVTVLLMWRLTPRSIIQPESDIQIEKGGTR